MKTSEPIELLWLDGVKLNRVSGFEKKRMLTRRIVRLDRGSANDIPTAWRIRRIDAGLAAGNANGSYWHAHARGRAARRRNPRIHRAHIRKSRQKSEHEDAIGRRTMQRDDLGLGDLRKGRHG